MRVTPIKDLINDHTTELIYLGSMTGVIFNGLNILPRTTRDNGGSLNTAHKKEKQMNREYLLKVLQNICFLA